ncbi:hypothetical protein H4R35_001181 [Dimargaris xerosporica]|nr:hypothetical protein H4R35_001181 [Dimargaris xerosporica]
MFQKLLTSLALSTALLQGSVFSHSWLDGTLYDPATKTPNGYGRGYPGRNNKDINTIYTYEIFDRNPESLLCDKNRQATPNYSNEFPMGSASPGQTLFVDYQINGHQNLPHTKMKIWMYRNTNVGEVKYGEHEKVGELVGEWDFLDLNRCAGNVASFSELHNNAVCYGSYKLPADLPDGQYSFAWVWHFDVNPKGQDYTTCFDLKVSGNGGSKVEEESSKVPSEPTSVPASESEDSQMNNTQPSVGAGNNGDQVKGTASSKSSPMKRPASESRSNPKCKRRCQKKCHARVL